MDGTFELDIKVVISAGECTLTLASIRDVSLMAKISRMLEEKMFFFFFLNLGSEKFQLVAHIT